MWRDHGVSDEQLLAAGSVGVAQAISEHARGDVDDSFFDLRCVQTVTLAITEVLPKKPPLGIALCDGDFVREVAARTKKISRDLDAVRKRYVFEIERPAHELSARALAIFDLYDDRTGEIHERLNEALRGDETAVQVSPPDDDQLAFYIHDFTFPEDGATTWSIILSFDDSDSCAHVELDGWIVQYIGWTH